MSNTKKIVAAGIIGALYAVFTIIQPYSSSPVQIRLAEAMCVLPFFYPFSAWGLFAGCVVANLIAGAGPLDIVFGSLATLAAGLIASKIRVKWLAPLPAVLINALVVGAVLYVYFPEFSYPVQVAYVGAGQLGACFVVGLPLLLVCERLIKKGALPPADKR